MSRYALDPVRAIGLVRGRGGAAVLAHPAAISRGWRIPDEAIAALAGAGLAGLEVDHPDHDQAERARLRVLAAGLGLVTTGGSDDHGEPDRAPARLRDHQPGSVRAADGPDVRVITVVRRGHNGAGLLT